MSEEKKKPAPKKEAKPEGAPAEKPAEKAAAKPAGEAQPAKPKKGAAEGAAPAAATPAAEGAKPAEAAAPGAPVAGAAPTAAELLADEEHVGGVELDIADGMVGGLDASLGEGLMHLRRVIEIKRRGQVVGDDLLGLAHVQQRLPAHDPAAQEILERDLHLELLAVGANKESFHDTTSFRVVWL